MLARPGLQAVHLLYPRNPISSGLSAQSQSTCCSAYKEPEQPTSFSSWELTSCFALLGLSFARPGRTLQETRDWSQGTSLRSKQVWGWKGRSPRRQSSGEGWKPKQNTKKSGEKVYATWLMVHTAEVALLHAWLVKEDYELANVRPQARLQVEHS